MAPPPLQKWKVLSKKNLTHNVIELKLEYPPNLKFRAGQYMSIVIPGAGPGGRNLRRAYSIASPPEWPEIEICFKVVDGGPGTTYLNRLEVGQTLEAQAPFGAFCINTVGNLPILFIGTGTGIAPLRAMVLSKEWQQRGLPNTLENELGFLLGVREEKDILYPELFDDKKPPVLQNHPHVHIALSKPSKNWTGFQGRVTHYIKQMELDSLWNFEKSHYYLCGSGDMLAEIKKWLMDTKAVTKEQIHVEKYY